jgi:diguanylate cyclase (GGDEF)-like protein
MITQILLLLKISQRILNNKKIIMDKIKFIIFSLYEKRERKKMPHVSYSHAGSRGEGYSHVSATSTGRNYAGHPYARGAGHPYAREAGHPYAREAGHPYAREAGHPYARRNYHPYHHGRAVDDVYRYRNHFYVPYVNTYFPVPVGTVYIDPLTQVYTLPAFQSYANYMVDNNNNIYLILIDIKDLASINQRWGINAGDSTLKSVAGDIRSVVGTDKYAVSRVGDDMFAILVNDLSYERINDIVSRLNDKITTTAVVGDDGIILSPTLYPRVTIGIFKKSDTETVDDLLVRAQTAMNDNSGSIFMTQP